MHHCWQFLFSPNLVQFTLMFYPYQSRLTSKQRLDINTHKTQESVPSCEVTPPPDVLDPDPYVSSVVMILSSSFFLYAAASSSFCCSWSLYSSACRCISSNCRRRLSLSRSTSCKKDQIKDKP